MDYPIVVHRLSDEDGGGYVAFFPDLIGCIGDGETPEEAVIDGLKAFDEWMDAAKLRNIPIPAPHSASNRANQERADLLTAIRDVRNHHDAIDARLDELERRVIEIEEQIAHADAWARFGVISGTVTVHETRLLG